MAFHLSKRASSLQLLIKPTTIHHYICMACDADNKFHSCETLLFPAIYPDLVFFEQWSYIQSCYRQL